MRDTLDSLALFDALSPDERADVEAALAAQPALAEAFARWRSLRAEVRADLARDLPDRALLVLYALADDDLLSDAERAHLDAARPEIEAAVAKHPGLAAAVRRIRADRDAFEQAWTEAVQPVPEAAPEPRPASARPLAADRPALRAHQRPTRWVWRTASLAALVAFVAVATFVFTRDRGWETVAASEARTVAFADGSTADLAAGARLMVPEAGAADPRQARLLGGRALFRIVRDPAEPFEVETPNAEVAVLGTTFTVEATDAQTDVVLVSGMVTLFPKASPEAAVRLVPGQRSRVVALDPPSTPERADLGAALDPFDATVAGQTAEVLAGLIGDRFGVPVAVDPALAQERLSVLPSGDTAEEALAALALALDARVEAAGDGFRLVAR